MERMKKNVLIFAIGVFLFVSCDSDFLVRAPLNSPSSETYWETPEQAEFWVNTLYNGLTITEGRADAYFDGWSDDAYGRAGGADNNIANGTFEPNDGDVRRLWDYSYIRHALEYFENIEQVSNISQERRDELDGQVHFHLAYQYYRLITLFRDVPLVTKPLSISESDIPKSPKEEVLNYLLEQVDLAIEKLPEQWPSSESGRATKGAALALKARVLLYNERWEEAATTAKQIMDSGIYELHPNFRELFMAEFNNQTKEIILARQYAENAETHQNSTTYAPVRTHRGFALVLPTNELQSSFGMEDGLPIDESPLYDPANPFDNRDPRYYDTFLYEGSELNGTEVDVVADFNFSLTYIYFRKHIQDFANGFRPGYANWPIFRYAEVLLTYAEAKNEATGPEPSIYDALDMVRMRAGLPAMDRSKYGDQASLREFIRNERRVELAGEALRYFDIIRWRIAEDTMNLTVLSMDPSLWSNRPTLPDGTPIEQRTVETRTFDPSRNYVWPIPQDAIDRSEGILVQHPEWQ
jgi:hypothetical protein